MRIKRLQIKTLALALPLFMGLSFVACGDDEPNVPGEDKDDKTEEIETPIVPEEPDKETAMSPIEQKEYLEEVALDFLQAIPASDFYDISDLGKHIEKTYCDDYNWDTVEDWADDAFKAAKTSLGTTTKDTETGTNYWDGFSDTYTNNYFYDNYTALLLASNFTGQFTASNNGWSYAKSNNLEFVFTDQYGKQCILKLQTSGDIKKVYAANIEEWKDYKWEENSTSNGYNYTSNDYYDYIACTIGVPENIVVTLTQNSKEVIKTTVKTDLSSITGEHFDIAKSNVTVSALVEINNGYKVNVSQAAYTGNTKGSVSTIISKNGTSLVTIGVSADVNNLPSVNIDAFSSYDFDEDKYNWDNVSGKNAFVKLDICGRVQIQGTISDVVKYADYLDEASDNDTNERNFKSYINQANSLSDVNLFYDGKSERQANIILEPFIDETWNGTTYWIAEPVIYFFDGSSYSSFEAFFNDTDFKATINAFNNLVDRYADLIE